mgnify:CR=1 FL=1
MADIAFEKDLSVAETGIGGLKVVDLAVHGDSRGWFKENWQRAKMTALGIPDLRVVQNNISYNDSRGVTRGIHAEPWDKFISVARGSVFGAWVDLREGSATYGKVFTCTLDPSKAIYVPRGVGNSFQALEDGTAYTYLVDAHWSLELKRTYTFVNLADPELAIEWPIPLDEATVSEADLNHPMLKDVVPMAPKRTLVTGCNGQLGHAVRRLAEERGLAKDFDFCDIDTFDMSDPEAYSEYDWSLYGTVINVYHALDMQELMSIGNFVSAHANEIAYNPNSPYVAQLESMMVTALSTPAAQPIMDDAQIANALGMIVAGMAQSYGNSGALFDDAFSGIFGF